MLIFDDDVNVNDVSVSWHHKKISMKSDWFESFVRSHILNPCSEPIDEIV